MKTKKTKTSAERQHAKRRAVERFNLKLNRKTLAVINSLIRNNQTIPIRKQSNRVSIHLVEYEGRKMKAVYDRNRKTVITFLYV